MYIIKIKNRNLFIHHSHTITEDINSVRTFIKTSGANNALNNYTSWNDKYHFYDKDDYEIVEVKITLI